MKDRKFLLVIEHSIYRSLKDSDSIFRFRITILDPVLSVVLCLQVILSVAQPEIGAEPYSTRHYVGVEISSYQHATSVILRKLKHLLLHVSHLLHPEPLVYIFNALMQLDIHNVKQTVGP